MGSAPSKSAKQNVDLSGVDTPVCQPALFKGWNGYDKRFIESANTVLFTHIPCRICPICREKGTYFHSSTEYECDECEIPHCEKHAETCHLKHFRNSIHI
mgnify:CR=1 FL=1